MLAFVRMSLCVVYLMVMGIMLMGCSTHNLSLLKQQSLPQATDQSIKVPEVIKDHDPFQFERIPFVISDDISPSTNYVRKLLVRLDNGQFRVIILEDSSTIDSLTSDILQR